MDLIEKDPLLKNIIINYNLYNYIRFNDGFLIILLPYGKYHLLCNGYNR